MKKILFILIFIPSVLLSQTNYYVDNTGTGDTLATITEVNALDLSAGDSVFFKRGCQWDNDPLTIAHSGVHSVHIYYGAYGTGSKPVINGNQSVSGWNTEGNWTEISTNIWRKAETYSTTRLWIDGSEVQRASTATVTNTLKWYWASSLLYVYSVGNPATTYSDITRVYNSYCLTTTADNADYITLQYLDIRGGNYSVRLNGVSDWTIDSCLIGRDVGNSGIWSSGSTGSTRHSTDSITITNCIFDTYDRNVDAYSYNNTYEAISVYDGANDWNIYDNVISDWGHSCYSIFENTTGYPFTGMSFHDNLCDASDIDYGRGFLVILRSDDSEGNKIYNNYFYEFGVWSEFLGSGLSFSFYNNIMDSVRATPYNLGETSHIVFLPNFGDVHNIEFYNNVLMRANASGIYFSYSGSAFEEADNLFKNNIFYNNGDYAINMQWSPEVLLDNNFSYNLLYNSESEDVVFYEKMTAAYTNMTVTEFNAQNGITTNMRDGEVADVIVSNIGGDPLLADPPDDYTLSEGSPAINAGIGVGLLTDYAGNAWADSPSIGAYEYDSSPPDPPGLPSVTTVTATALSATSFSTGGSSISDGGGTVSAKGVCWGYSINPTISNYLTESGTGTTSFTRTITALPINTTIHYRAYVTNESGTGYGEDKSFTTPVQGGITNGGRPVTNNGKTVIRKNR